MPNSVALIPARGGSKRVPGKNVRPLAGHPLIAYTVSAALECGEFDRVIVSSDDPATLELAHSYGADALRRPEQLATGTSPDIEWVSHALSVLHGEGNQYSAFSILRPTSPFRTPATIRRAFAEWQVAHGRGEHYSSLRAVEPCSQRPEKMWRIHGKELVPLLLQPGATHPLNPLHPEPGYPRVDLGLFQGEGKAVTPPSCVIPAASCVIATGSPLIPTGAEGSDRSSASKLSPSSKPSANARSDPSASVGMTQEVFGMTNGGPASPAATPQPWHDSQAASLPPIYVQNASLEIAWTRTVEETGTISGHRVLPFLTCGHEGFDINTELDWSLAEMLIERGEAALP